MHLKTLQSQLRRRQLRTLRVGEAELIEHFSLSLSLSLSLFLSLSLSDAHPHSLSLSRTLKRTHTHTHFLSLSLSYFLGERRPKILTCLLCLRKQKPWERQTWSEWNICSKNLFEKNKSSTDFVKSAAFQLLVEKKIELRAISKNKIKKVLMLRT